MQMHRLLLAALACLALPGWAAETGDADLTLVRSQLITLITPPELDSTRLAQAAAEAVASQGADGCWADIDYADRQRSAWKAAQHLNRHVWKLALHLNRDPQAAPAVAEALRRGLDAWFRLDLRNDNWWHNEIGVPMALGNILLMAGDAVDPGRRAQACAIMRRSNYARWTGQNLVWGVNIEIMRGCIEGDRTAVAAGFARYAQEVRTGIPPHEGVQVDASFHQHGNLIYSGGYGQGFSVDGARLLSAAKGSAFQAPAAVSDVLATYMLDGQRWMLRGATWDFGVVGRECCRQGKNARGLAAAARLMAGLGLPRSAELAAMAASIAADRPDPGLSGNRHFWCSDYMAHQRPGFSASVRMHSTRVDNTDSLTNGENKRSHFIADGATCLMRDGGEYRDIYPVWDWQRVPGITCEQRPAMPEAKLVRRHGSTAFVGGVSDGRIGLAAMQHQRGTLSARKAWLLLDDAVVCLGAGITCTSGLPVATSLNQCLLRGPVQRAPGDGQWIWHDGFGYALLAPGALTARADAQRGAWSDIGVGKADPLTVPVFSLAIDHGRDPAGAAYAYVVLPGIAAEAMPAWQAAPPVRMLANTAELQAAEDRAAGVLGAVFHQPGRLDGRLAADKPCLVLLRRDGGDLVLSVANPENTALEVAIEIAEAVRGEGVEALPGGSRIRVALPAGDDAGRSVVRRLAMVR